jgi:TPR repeat protein
MKITDRDMFNKVLSHLAGVRFKRKTRVAQHKHLCIYKQSLDQCIACREVAKWHRIGAEQDILGSQHSLGYCYSIGMGVPQSDVEAANWFGKAAAGGHTDSISSLREIFSKISNHSTDDSSSECEESTTEDPR